MVTASERDAATLDDPATAVGWDAIVDVVVVGFGGAGATAAIEAAASGAEIGRAHV